MIKVTRLNDKNFYINSELIETLESTPDTIITLVNGKKVVVKESPESVIEKIVEFKSRVRSNQREV